MSNATLTTPADAGTHRLGRPTDPPPLHLLGTLFRCEGKVWRVVSLHGFPGHYWAWIVNIANGDDQRRLSVAGIPTP